MGQQTSRSTRYSAISSMQSLLEGAVAVSPMPMYLKKIAQMLFGGDTLYMNDARMPSSWDKLIDWCEDAEKLSARIYHSRTRENHDTQNEDDIFQVGITPLVASPRIERKQIESLPDISPIHQANFFDDSVVIKLDQSRSNDHSPSLCRILSTREFIVYYKLLRRLEDLFALTGKGKGITSRGRAPVHSTKLTECVICFEQSSNSILPCNHSLCESCERRWVHVRLACPFCRAKFRNVNEIRDQAWNLSESPDCALRNDMDYLIAQLFAILSNCQTTDNDVVNTLYKTVARCIGQTQEDDEFVVWKL